MNPREDSKRSQTSSQKVYPRIPKIWLWRSLVSKIHIYRIFYPFQLKQNCTSYTFNKSIMGEVIKQLWFLIQNFTIYLTSNFILRCEIIRDSIFSFMLIKNCLLDMRNKFDSECLFSDCFELNCARTEKNIKNMINQCQIL